MPELSKRNRQAPRHYGPKRHTGKRAADRNLRGEQPDFEAIRIRSFEEENPKKRMNLQADKAPAVVEGRAAASPVGVIENAMRSVSPVPLAVQAGGGGFKPAKLVYKRKKADKFFKRPAKSVRFFSRKTPSHPNPKSEPMPGDKAYNPYTM